ncbi:MAG: hypothetical protein HUU20_26885 [Pirellulales bacterium]|nr:hypothetical protein [Pirellulales bacterium]
MFTVALIGPDGAGKTTISHRLRELLPLPVKYVYMGVNADSSNHMLPTTRLVRALKRFCGAKPDTAGPRDPNQVRMRPKGLLRRAAAEAKSMLGFLARASEEIFRQTLAEYYRWRGHVVLFDRHYFSDYYNYDIASHGRYLPLGRRLHGLFLQHVYPKPDLVVYLDAPAEVLFARKGEGSIAVLERRRQDYLQMRELVRQFVVVDASRPQEEVARDVADRICRFCRANTDGVKEAADVA